MTVFRQGGEDYLINDPNIADEFNPSAIYRTGDYVTYQGSLCRFIAYHAAGAWNASHIVEVKLGDDVKTVHKNNDDLYQSASLDSGTLKDWLDTYFPSSYQTPKEIMLYASTTDMPENAYFILHIKRPYGTRAWTILAQKDNSNVCYFGVYPNNGTITWQRIGDNTAKNTVVESGTLKEWIDSNYASSYQNQQETFLYCKTTDMPEDGYFIVSIKRAYGTRAWIIFAQKDNLKDSYIGMYAYGKPAITWLANSFLYDERIAIKDAGSGNTRDGFKHQAFPGMAYFNNKYYIASKLGQGHMTGTDPSEWGGLVIDSISMDGSLKKGSVISKSSFTNLDGELRDVSIQTTRDGKYLILISWTTYYVNEQEKHDNVVALIDKSDQIISYKVSKDTGYLYWGSPLITPTGYLLLPAYNNISSSSQHSSVILLRSTTPLTNDVSGLTFETINIAATNDDPCEPGFGYFNNKLCCVMRQDSGNSLFTQTENLEGTSGWSEPVDIGYPVHAVRLLPYCSGKYLVFAGAYVESAPPSSLRVPALGLYDVENNAVIAIESVDSQITGYSGYCGFVKDGEGKYAFAYYQEDTNAGVYFKKVNGRALLPALNYTE